MVSRLLLLGDSVIDNGVYVRPGEPDVTAQVKAQLPGYEVVKRAVDGAVTRDVRAAQIGGIGAGDLVVVSAGGNDALGRIGILNNPEPVVSEAVLLELWQVRESFRGEYQALIGDLAKTGAPLLVLTIYDPNFDRVGGPQTSMQRAAEAALSILNDVIQQTARAHGADVLELRHLFTSAADFANPIEPSAVGGDKIAAALARWAGKTGRN